MKYADGKTSVVKDLNLNIRPGWKVEVVGRTRAEKSSLISVLFRLIEDGLDGKIILDEINTKMIGLNDLWSGIPLQFISNRFNMVKNLVKSLKFRSTMTDFIKETICTKVTEPDFSSPSTMLWNQIHDNTKTIEKMSGNILSSE
ncbi:ATP-binding cassette transporter abc2-like [Neodiprion fabricii]|uniref:ATP-binding cassette transporter abc2-like n=1 Tax=Neodiprion fabricii TaxID=2872261 RepID=UPI001ED8C694|nr:ATP-binding cassette transporter abc2-like [Neodiprion fabricii]